MGILSALARVAWPLLLVTICVYLLILVESLSIKHQVTTRQTEPFQILQQMNITLSNRTLLQTSHEQKDKTDSTERTPKYHPSVTKTKENTTYNGGNGLYLNEPVDKHEYKYIHNPYVFCRKKDSEPKPIFLLIMIPTAPKNIIRRNVLRGIYRAENAWPRLSKGAIEAVFLLGKTDNRTLQSNIDRESELHGDIVQEDFVDSYKNLTIKTVMGLKWMTNHCRHASYVIKCDDDSVIIQVRFFAAFLNSPTTNWAAGNALLDSPVARNTSEKFFLPKDFYPLPTYPPYLNGPGYILSTDLVERIYKVAVTTPLFPWEDVFIGLCLQKLEVVPHNVDTFLMLAPKHWPVSFKENGIEPFGVKTYSVISNIEPEYIPMIWEAGRLTFKKY